MEFEETFFDDMIADVMKVKVDVPNGDFLKGWNAAVQVCISRLYGFFGQGHPPKEVREPFLEAYRRGAAEELRGTQPPAEEAVATPSEHKIRPAIHDPINSPDWYCWGGIETLDFILAKQLDFLLGNVVKYVSRAGHKDPEKTIEDLKKARYYLDKEIEILER